LRFDFLLVWCHGTPPDELFGYVQGLLDRMAEDSKIVAMDFDSVEILTTLGWQYGKDFKTCDSVAW
jgi:hypothetical protein